MNRESALLSVPGIRPYFEFNEELLSRIGDLLRSGQVTNHGPQVHQFEQALARYLGVQDHEAVAVSNGSDGLLLALLALQLPPGKVILPAYTYIATLNAVVHSRFEPVFCDIEPRSFTMDSQHLANLLKQHAGVQCVIPVNVFGVPADLETIRRLCDQSGAKLLYDNAHGFGTELDGRRFLPEPDVQVFSFHATKALPSVEGGLIVSGNAEILAHARRLRNHGLASSIADTIPGFNAKLDEIRAVIGMESLRHFPGTLSRRRTYGARLMSAFQAFPEVYNFQRIPENVNSNFQNIGVCCPVAAQTGLQRVLDEFKKIGIGVRSYFDPPLYKFRGFDQGISLPQTELVWRTLVSFPIHSRMPEETLCYLEEAIGQVASKLKSFV